MRDDSCAEPRRASSSSCSSLSVIDLPSAADSPDDRSRAAPRVLAVVWCEA